ncbi:MAG: hypothetical protein PW845_14040 [Pseudomonas sp.]|uniref:hypothetical protein n=1 Tax=Pseudomonas abieticivorans TaxID=2931382 RepID=UPI0020BF6532|nr:hypothetical protein [Pseudomonas sp. PIA16]MDE1166465.1 hypothetical protein [Pseudomonas sp.]
MPFINCKHLLSALALAAMPGLANAAQGTLDFNGAITENTCIIDLQNDAHPNSACDHCDAVDDHVSIVIKPIDEHKQLVTLIYS